MPARIGTLTEKSLHAQLKQRYARPGDRLEYALDGYVVDIARPWVRGEGPAGQAAGIDADLRCIEIQTRRLSAMKPKLEVLLARRPVHVVFPVAQQSTIARMDARGDIVSRRKSPKHGGVYAIFPELVGLPHLVAHPGLTLEVLLIREEQVWRDDGQGSWRRRRWSIYDRRLLEVVEAVPLAGVDSFAALLPNALPAQFDTRELASAIAQPLRTAQQMAYCLRQMGVLTVARKRGNALVYGRAGG